jgi:5-methylcytosine-specific restriction endonuclease McrA
MVERLRAQAKVEPVLVGVDGEPITVGRLEVHHLWPSSWGGSDELWNLAAVCWHHHHHHLAPQGRGLLLGNPNNPAGLSLIDRDDLPKLATLAADHGRAGPRRAGA